jgi:hypothetical protein
MYGILLYVIKMSIGAFYQCHKRPLAFEMCLKSFRQSYPTSDLIVFNDGGDVHLEGVARKYDATYFYREKTGNGVALYFNSAESTMEWLRRLQMALDLIKEDYFILLEDDVKVVKKIESELLFDINGSKYDFFLHESLQKYLGSREKLFYGGGGGSIFKKDFFKKVFQDARLQEHVNFLASSGSIIASDIVISFLTYCYGGTLGQYAGFTETWHHNYNERVRKGVEVIHDYKLYYDQPTPNYTIYILLGLFVLASYVWADFNM